ncbi:MAG: hypothetical protein ABIP20_15620 [Chthoniobacteraceae bacterium]
MKLTTPLLALALAATALAEDDGKLTIAIPSSVQATIAREKGDTGTVRDFRKVNESDGTTYIVGIVVNGKTWELSLDASGRVMRKRLDTGDGGPRMLRIEALPANVRETMQRETGAGVIGEVEFIEQKTRYIGESKIGKRKYRIEVDAEGVLLNKEYIGEED